jgi:hypothetical protein
MLFQLLGSSPLCDDNPHENISKIYKEEFSRIMQESGRLTDKQSPEGLVPGPPPGLPFFPGLGAGGFFQRGAPPTDFARAMDIYHQVPNLTKYYSDSSQNVAHFTK